MAVEYGQRLKHADALGTLPKGWLAFRKFDGHSVIWLPKSQDLPSGISGLWSLGRFSGPKSINVPATWLMYLPMDQALHGELWAEDDRPTTVKEALHKVPTIDKWKKLKLVVFAFPSNETFNPADKSTWKNINSDKPWDESLIEENRRVIAPKSIDLGNETAQEFTTRMGWEGLVFQNPKAKYRIGRSSDVLKWKPYYDDECIVTGYTEGKAGKTGNRLGTCGALQVKWTATEKTLTVHGCEEKFLGVEKSFRVGGMNEDEWCEAEKHYPIGSVLKFKFYSLTNLGTPQFCSIWRED